MKMALKAFNCGFKPTLAMPKTFSGSVCDCAPEVKTLTMYSSSDKVKDMSAPAMTAGMRYGSTTFRKAWKGVAPRSIAASSSEGSIPCKRACTPTSTKGKQKVVWAMTMVVYPRGIFKTCTKRTNKLTPMRTSGITIGTKMSKARARWNGKR